MNNLKRTIKEQEFIKAYIECKGNSGKAYLQLFPHVKKESAWELGSRLLKKVGLSMSELLDRIGVDDHLLSEKLQAGLNSANPYIVARYLDMAYKLKAKYPVDRSRLELTGAGGDPLSITLNEVVYDKGKPVRKQDKPTKEEKAPF